MDGIIECLARGPRLTPLGNVDAAAPLLVLGWCDCVLRFGCERFSEIPDSLGEGVAVEHRRQESEVEGGEETAAWRPVELLTLEHVDLDEPFAPDPDFLDAEFFVDLKFVDAASRPFDFDRQLRPIAGLRSEDVALIRFGAPLLLLFLQGPAADRGDFHASFDTPGLQQMSDERLDQLVIPGRTQDLELPFEIGDARSRFVATNLEQALVVVP